MYLPDLIREVVQEKLNETFLQKSVTIHDINKGEVTFICKTVEFQDDDGDCWLRLTDTDDVEYITDGQGIDIWFEVNGN